MSLAQVREHDESCALPGRPACTVRRALPAKVELLADVTSTRTRAAPSCVRDADVPHVERSTWARVEVLADLSKGHDGSVLTGVQYGALLDRFHAFGKQSIRCKVVYRT